MNDETLKLLGNISQFIVGITVIVMPTLLFRLYLKRRDLPFCQAAVIFSLFLLFGGILIVGTALFKISLLWITILKFLTAVSATCSAVFLWKIVPIILELRSPNELEASEARFKEFLNSAPDGIIVADQHLKICLVNQKICSLLGYEKTELMNKNLEKLLGQDLPIAKYELGIAEDKFIINKYGTPIAVNINFTPVVIDRQLMLIASFHDVGQQKHLERLAGIGEMVTGLAHESRNCLQQSQAALELISWKPIGKDVAELVETAMTAHQELNALFDEVRFYAMKPRLKQEIYNLEEIIEDVWSDLSVKRMNKTAVLDIDCSFNARVDRAAFKRVFRNVIENSLASSENEVYIKVSQLVIDGRKTISIKDNGPGLNIEQRNKIFEPFYTTKTKGTGLGMAIVKRIVEEHKGKVSLGNPTTGAEILITLDVEDKS